MPVQPPEGATLVGFKYSAQGMSMQPRWSIRQVEGGFACAETWGELYWPAIDGEDAMEWVDYDEARGYGFDGGTTYGDPLGPDAGMHSLTSLTDADMAELLGILVEHDVLSWDGFDEVRTWPEGMIPTDTGSTFELKLAFSDGTRMRAHGVDSYPATYNDAMVAVRKFIEAHTDYSAYYPKAFPDSPARSLIVQFAPALYSSGSTRYSLELWKGRSQWIVVLEDPRGELLPAGTNVSDYATTDAELPFDRFLQVIRDYGLESWNQASGHDAEGLRETCTMRITFENGQLYDVSTNVRPENYDAFKAAMVAEIAAYYEEVRQ